MIAETPDDFAAALTAGPLLGLDPGTKTVGVAASDPARRIAMPVTVIKRAKFAEDAAQILALAAERGAAGFVIGLPLNMDGGAGPSAQRSKAFARNLTALTDLPILLWDERLSTAEAERALIALDTKRAKRAETLDAHAAAVLLQAALGRLTQR